MELPFLDRRREVVRLRRALGRGGLLCLYGRRRLGKSRLIRELLANRPAVYFVGDDRDAPLQREAVARRCKGWSTLTAGARSCCAARPSGRCRAWSWMPLRRSTAALRRS